MKLFALLCALVLCGGNSAFAQDADPFSTVDMGNVGAETAGTVETAQDDISAPQANEAIEQTTQQPKAQVLTEAPAKAQAPATAQSIVVGANVNQNFIDAVGQSGIKNIVDAEQVFCYEIGNKPAGYQGYTMNNMALNGFCGVLNKDLSGIIVNQLLEVPEHVAFDVSEDCTISPKIMLRFVRGVDYTDVLFSSPCHSIAIFYGGKLKAFNMRPGAEMIDTIVDSFGKNRIDFVSPALLNQMMPIGIVQNAEQQSLVDSKKGNQPVRGWDQQSGGKSSPSGAEQPKKSGWNNLNM